MTFAHKDKTLRNELMKWRELMKIWNELMKWRESMKIWLSMKNISISPSVMDTLECPITKQTADRNLVKQFASNSLFLCLMFKPPYGFVNEMFVCF